MSHRDAAMTNIEQDNAITLPMPSLELAQHGELLSEVATAEEAPLRDLHRVYIIWPFRHISHKTETDSPDLAIAAFVQLMRMRHKSHYAIGVGWDINGKLKKYLDY